MGNIVSRSADRVLRWRLLLPFVPGLLDTASAYGCSFMDEQAAATEAEAASGQYRIGAIVLGGILIGLELRRQRRTWVIPAITVGLLVFHPSWTLPPLHGPDCVFVNVQTSQAVLAVICLVLGYRMVGQMLTQRHRVTATIAASIGFLVASTTAISALVSSPPEYGLDSRYLLALLPPWLLLAGITIGLMVAVGLGTTTLLKRTLHR